MMPATATIRPCSSSDHSYELPLRRNLLLLLDLLDLLRFIAGVLLDRLGVAPCHGVVRLPGGRYWGGELLDAAAAERTLEAASRALTTTAPLYGRRRASHPPADGRGTTVSSAEEEEDEGVCAICLSGLDAGGGCQVVAELCSCSHAFHAVCIDAWVSSGEAAATCPLCRAPVSPAAWLGVGACHARAPC